MRQFDICRLGIELIVVLQHDLLSGLKTVVVAPLSSPERVPPAGRLRPLVSFEGRDYVLAIERLAAVDRQRLGPVLGSLEPRRHEIIGAIDVLVTGI